MTWRRKKTDDASTESDEPVAYSGIRLVEVEGQAYRMKEPRRTHSIDGAVLTGYLYDENIFLTNTQIVLPCTAITRQVALAWTAGGDLVEAPDWTLPGETQ